MRKAILLFTLLLSAMNVMAQAYEFEIKDGNEKRWKYFDCDTKIADLGISSPQVSFGIYDVIDSTTLCVLHFYLVKTEKSDIVSSLKRLVNEMPKGISKNTKNINLHLSNGDIIGGMVDGDVFVSDVTKTYYNFLDDMAALQFIINASWVSKYYPEQKLTFKNQQVICQQLRTYDIVKIEIGNESFDVRGLRSAATFDAMFNALAAKTGKGHLYRYDSSSSSSSSTVSSGPSATCELGFVGVYSWGRISCRVDNFRIIGAKGKDVEVNVMFEDVTDEFVTYGFVEKLTSVPYDDCTYEEIRLKGEANELDRLNRYGSGRFKVYVEVDVGNSCIYTSNAKYITIYKDGDSWRKK